MSTENTSIVRFSPERLKAIRGEMSLKDFAEKTGFKYDYLSKVERGQRNLSIDGLSQLCSATNKFPNDFFDISTANR